MGFLKTNIFIIRVSSSIGFFFFFSSIVLFILLLLKRFYLIHKEKRNNLFLEKWKPILLDNLYSLPESFTNIPKKNVTLFLILWNNLQEILNGPENEQLNQLARSLHMDQEAIQMLYSRKFSKRLLAISILGSLRHEQSWDRIYDFSQSSNMTLAINALDALAKINPERSINTVITFMTNRKDWPKYKIAMILNEIGPNKFSKPLAHEILLLDSEKQSHLLIMMNSADGQVALSLVNQLLSITNDNEVISACLNLLSIFGDNRDISVVKAYLTHKESFIRMKAVKCLALIGTEDELPYLEKCLSDQNWWVRYRAAEAITILPTMNNEKIIEIRDRQSDRFAIDILNYIISKKGCI